jgi:hypothetical protein
MHDRVLADLRDPREREGVPAEQIMQIVARSIHKFRIGRDYVCDHQVHAILRSDSVRAPDKIRWLEADMVGIGAVRSTMARAAVNIRLRMAALTLASAPLRRERA